MGVSNATHIYTSEKAVRIITLSKYNAHTAPIFTTAYSKDNVQFYHITSYKLWYIGLGVSNATHIYTSEKAVRIITLSKYNAHTAPIYTELKLLKVSDIYKLQVLKFYHQLINKQLPEYFYNIPYINTCEIHQYDTRDKNRLFMSQIYVENILDTT